MYGYVYIDNEYNVRYILSYIVFIKPYSKYNTCYIV